MVDRRVRDRAAVLRRRRPRHVRSVDGDRLRGGVPDLAARLDHRRSCAAATCCARIPASCSAVRRSVAGCAPGTPAPCRACSIAVGRRSSRRRRGHRRRRPDRDGAWCLRSPRRPCPTFRDPDLLIHWDAALGTSQTGDGPDRRTRRRRAPRRPGRPRRRRPRRPRDPGRPDRRRRLRRDLARPRSRRRLRPNHRRCPARRQRLSGSPHRAAHVRVGSRQPRSSRRRRPTSSSVSTASDSTCSGNRPRRFDRRCPAFPTSPRPRSATRPRSRPSRSRSTSPTPSGTDSSRATCGGAPTTLLSGHRGRAACSRTRRSSTSSSGASRRSARTWRRSTT